MTRYYTPVNAQIEKPWWKSLPILGTLGMAIAIGGYILYNEFTIQPVIHIRAEDNSQSASGDVLQRQLHCQVSSHNYKPGYTVINIPFADRPVLTKEITLVNSLSFLGECQKTKPEITSKKPGTSLLLLLERGKEVIQEQRSQKNHSPVVFTILANAFEPGPDQPVLDFNRVKTLIDEITKQQTVVAIMIPPGELQEQLANHLQGRASVCPLNEGKNEDEVRQSILPCVDNAFNQARQLKVN